MAIYSFGYDLDGRTEEGFDSGTPDFRSDSEQRNSPLSVYNPESLDVKTARTLSDEMINISGAEVKVFIRTDNNDFDAVWDEDADPTYWSSEMMKAFFKPAPLETELKKWGADTVNKTEVVFSHRQVFQKFGERMLRPGDVIQLPFNAAMDDKSPKTYRVVNASPSGNFRYNWLYLSCAVETLNADISIRPHELDSIPDEVDTRTNGAYRESF
jgi:hypothetical protein